MNKHNAQWYAGQPTNNLNALSELQVPIFQNISNSRTFQTISKEPGLTKPNQIDKNIEPFYFLNDIVIQLQLHKVFETPQVVNFQYVCNGTHNVTLVHLQ